MNTITQKIEEAERSIAEYFKAEDKTAWRALHSDGKSYDYTQDCLFLYANSFDALDAFKNGQEAVSETLKDKKGFWFERVEDSIALCVESERYSNSSSFAAFYLFARLIYRDGCTLKVV